MFYFARCTNIIFNSLLAQLVRYDVHTSHSQNKIHTRYFLSIVILRERRSTWLTETDTVNVILFCIVIYHRLLV